MILGITSEEKKALIEILEELLLTISKMNAEKKDDLLKMNEQDAEKWLKELKSLSNKRQLKQLKKQISWKLVYIYDVEITYNDNCWGPNAIRSKEFYEYEKLDRRRTALMDDFLWACTKVIKGK